MLGCPSAKWSGAGLRRFRPGPFVWCWPQHITMKQITFAIMMILSPKRSYGNEHALEHPLRRSGIFLFGAEDRDRPRDRKSLEGTAVHSWSRARSLRGGVRRVLRCSLLRRR